MTTIGSEIHNTGSLNVGKRLAIDIDVAGCAGSSDVIDTNAITAQRTHIESISQHAINVAECSTSEVDITGSACNLIEEGKTVHMEECLRSFNPKTYLVVFNIDSIIELVEVIYCCHRS